METSSSVDDKLSDKEMNGGDMFPILAKHQESSDLDEYEPGAEDEDEDEDQKSKQAVVIGYHNRWSSDGGPVEVDSDPSSDVEYYSDDASLNGNTNEGEKTDEYESNPIAQQTRQEKARLLALRRHLDELSEQVLEKDYIVIQSREELKKCRDVIESLEQQIEDVRKQIEIDETNQYMASLGRLNSQYSKLCTELANEKDVLKIKTKQLEDAEYALAQALAEQGKFLVAGEEIDRNDRMAERHKLDASASRIRRENATAAVTDRRRRNREKEHVSALRDRERKHRQALTAAKRNREHASKFLKETMSRVRQKEAEEEERSREYLDNRMQAVLTLKRNIETNKENLKALQARDAKLARELEEQEEQEREGLLAQGLNPDELMTRRKRIQQFEKDKEAFEKRQRERQIEIADHILKEEKQMKKRYQQQPQLWPEKQRAKRTTRRRPKPKFFKSTSGSSSMEYSADVEDTGDKWSSSRLVAVSSDDDDDFSPYGETSRDEAKAGDSDIDITEDLAEPEFKGLWEEDHDKGSSTKTVKKRFTAHAPTTMEQEIMDRSLVKQRAGIVQKQVAAGREFKGCAFYSKPEVIIFKDFDVGKSYRKKVILTNISYTQNFCKYIGMSHVLKDFIDIQFDPPGVMSAGLTCDFMVTFKPMLNEDLEGQIDFLAQTGPFSLPIKCMTKKCQVSVDMVEVDFSSQVVGETRKRYVIMKNNGALGTDFEFRKITAADRSDATSDISSIGGMTITEENGEEDQQVEGEEARPADKEETEVTGTPTVGGEGMTDEQPVDDKGVTESKSGTVVQFEEPVDESVDATDGIDTGLPGLPTDDPVLVDGQISDGLRVGKISSGRIDPGSEIQLEIIFNPSKAGNVLSDFEISFTDPLSPPIMVRGRGCGIDVPVWVHREVVDLKICMYDRLYQDAILVNNRATSALRLKFEVCKELKGHLELLPKMAYIQAESQFSAQLKFLPRQSLATDCPPSIFNPDTGLLEAPMTIRVADQTRVVPFTVRAIVTSSDIEFSAKDLDFGYCTLYESVRHTVTLTNRSVLPQSFGFCGTPETIDVQPNDGFGTLLPFESFDVDIIFNAKKAKEYKFELACKTGIGREFKLPCRAVGVLPPLELSHSLIQMKATSMDDTCSAHFEVINSHTSANEFTHPVPRIGTGPICEVGPTSFEFVVPQGAPLTVSPSVGMVMPGQRCIVHVTFHPRLDVTQVKQEAVKIVEREAEAERKRKEAALPSEKPQDNTANQKKKVKGKNGKGSPKRNATPSSPSHSRKASAKIAIKTQYSIDDIIEGSNDYEAAHLSLLRTLPNEFNRYVIPCFVASGRCTDPGNLPYSVHNTLYLEVHCPTVTPSIVVISDSGRSTVDFGNVSLGQSDLKTLTIQNISNEALDLKSSLLDPHGPFQMLNALRTLEPQATHTVVLAFEPTIDKEFNEVVELLCARNTLSIRLKGRGVNPAISLSVPDGVLDLGDALVNDAVTSTFKIFNTSELSITYNLKLDSHSPLRHSRAQVLPRYLEQYSGLEPNTIVGPANCSGVAVVDCVPGHGVIAAGESKEITVTFAPDHPSEHYVDVMSVELNDGDKAQKIELIGRGWPSLVFIQGFDELTPSIESLVPHSEHDDDEDTKVVKTVLLTFRSCSTPDGFGVAERLIDIGCIKSSIQTKKSSDYFFENPKEANEKGFTFDPLKAGVDIGTKRRVTCRWQPPPGHDPNTPMNTSTVLTVKADVTTQYKILLKGFITTVQQTTEQQPVDNPPIQATE